MKRRALEKLQSIAGWLAPALYGPSKDAIDRMLEGHNMAQTRMWQSCGTQVRISPSAHIEHPRGMAVGHRVHIADDVMIDAQGGVLIGDDAKIGSRALLMSSAPSAQGPAPRAPEIRDLAPIEIGAGAALEPGVTLLPGSRIGAGAVVLAGTTIRGDVAPGAIVAPGPPAVVAAHPQDDGGPNAARGAAKGPHAAPHDCKQPEIVFVLTTGRSGSTALADILDKHPRICARHEPRMQFIAWSTQFARGEIDAAEMTRRLRAVFLETSVFEPDRIYVESDQKYFNLVDDLHAILPEAKFIWLTRSAEAVVASSYARGWYREDEPGTFFEDDVYWAWKTFRIAGPDTGEVNAAAWAAMDGFERNAWYWSYANRTIRDSLARLPRAQWIWADIDAIETHLPEILDLLGVAVSDLPVVKSNASSYGRHQAADWSDAQRASYERHCGSLMRSLYVERVFA